MGLFSNGARDTGGGEGKPIDGATASAVSAASEQVKSKRGGARVGAGRKPGNGGAVVGGSPERKAQPAEAEVSEADIEFVKTIAEAGLKILTRVETNHICGLINSIGDDYVRERTESYLKQCEIGPGDVDVVVNAAGAIAAKYSVLSRYAPEMALCSWACIHGMAFSGVTADLRKLAVVVKAAKAKGVTNDHMPRVSTTDNPQ